MESIDRSSNGFSSSFVTSRVQSWSSAFTELLFVDATLPDYLTLVNGARSEVMVVVLSPLANPWEQMTTSLLGLESVKAVHIASHGTAAELVIAGHAYTGADLSNMAPLLSSWKSALTENADILLYGCDVASSSTGHAFIETLSTLTGADVAASVDATGPSAIGADWNLEANAGEIQTASAFNQSVIDGYEFRLASTSFTSTAGTNVGSAVGTGKLVTFNPINLTETGASAQLIIRANDVDYGLKNSSNVPYAVGNKNSEWDGVYIQKVGSSDFSFVGYLNGTNNNWSYTTFDISSFVSKSGVGSYVVRVVPDDDGTQSQKSNGGTWVVTVPSVEIFLGGSQSISALSEVGQTVTSTWSADQVGAYTIQYILTDASGRAVAQANVNTNETEIGANQTNAAQLVPNSNFYKSWSALPSGTYTLQATLVDSLGVVRGVKTTETVLDMTAPTVQVTSDLKAFKSGDAGLLTLTFSEAPVGLTLDDLTSSNGTLSGLQATADAMVYQVKFTPAAGFEGDVTVGVKAGSYTDAAGNAGEAGSLSSLHVDTLVTKVQVSSDVQALKTGEAATMTLTFSEAPVGLTLDDLTSSNGALSGLHATADAKVYQVKFTPAAGFEGDATVNIKAASYTDAAGNAGEAGSLSGLHVDTLVTKVQVSSDVQALKTGEAATMTLTFSEAPVGLTLDDLTSSNGALSGLHATADAKVYQVKFTPAAGFEGDATVSIKAGSYTDAAGNAGEVGSLSNLHVDTLATKVQVSLDVQALKTGEAASMTLTFSEAPVGLTLDDLTSSNGTLSGLQATADAKVYQVKFTPAAGFEGDATVGVKAGSYTDAAGNAGEAGSLSGLQVDTLVPTVQITASDLTLVAGHTSILTFTFSDVPKGFDASDIIVKHGSVRGLQVTNNPLVYTAVFVPEEAYVGGASVSLVKGAYTDSFGNEGSPAALAGMAISNHVLSQLDFEVTQTWGYTEVLAPGDGMWHTDNAKNMVEIGTERVYGSPAWWLKNHVIELADNPGDASNLYTQFDAASGTQLKLSFDYSARSDASRSAFEVVWGGKVIDMIDPGKPFCWKHADYTLDVSSTGVQRLELRAVDKSSYGAVLDNVTLLATQVTALTASNKSVTMSKLDFQNEDYWLYSWHVMKMADNHGWFTDNALGKVELGRETVYGGKIANNRVIELAANSGDSSNLYTNLLLEQGSHFQFTFDISARQGEDSRVSVLWGGKVIDVIDPGRNFGWQTHTYDLVANGDMQRLELQAVNHNAFGAVLDNLTLATHAVV